MIVTYRHMTVGLVDFDSNVGRILVLLNTNRVCVTDSATHTRQVGIKILSAGRLFLKLFLKL